MSKYSDKLLENQFYASKLLVDGQRNWSIYKLKSLAIAHSYSVFDDLERYSRYVSQCGSWLKFSVCPKGHEKRLIQASFCRVRL